VPIRPATDKDPRLLRTASGITLIKVTVFNSSAKIPDSCDAAYVVSHVRAVCRPPV